MMEKLTQISSKLEIRTRKDGTILTSTMMKDPLTGSIDCKETPLKHVVSMKWFSVVSSRFRVLLIPILVKSKL